MELEFKVVDEVEGSSTLVSTIEEALEQVAEIKAYAEQEGYEPEYGIWLRIA